MSYTVIQHHFDPYPEDVVARAGVEHFGRVAQDWKTFKADIAAERAATKDGEDIKIVFFSRHGHAIHNDIPELPMPHWARLLGKREVNALDPALTIIGEEQVSLLNAKLKREVEEGLPTPTMVLTSIARRTCQTSLGTWADIVPDTDTQGVHDLRDYLCGKQFSRLAPFAEIRPLFPQIKFESSPHTNDELWQELDGKEAPEVFAERITQVFDDIWQRAEGHEVISIVSHLDVFEVLWPMLGLPITKFEKGEMRMLVIKRTM